MPTALEELVGKMSVSELAAKAGRDIAEIVAFALDGKSKGPARPRTNGTTPRASTTTSIKSVDTRSASGRDAYQRQVLEAIRAGKDYVSAVEIRAKTGGTPQQFRAAVNRLIEDGDVEFRGKARATRYIAT